MKILVVNKFLHHVGGVETYLDWQARNLDRIGVDAHFFGMAPPDGQEVLPSIHGRETVTPHRDFNGTKRAATKAAMSSIYSPLTERMLTTAIDRFRPDLVHFHSTCRQLTSSVARAVTRKKLPGVLTVHEYKQVCATQRLWDERRNCICTDCLTGSAASRMKNVAVRRCVRGSTAASIFAIPEIPIADHIWANSNVTIHAPSHFIGGIIEGARYISNPVQVMDLPWGEPQHRGESENWQNGAIFAGRLEKEKGVDILLDAWRIVKERKQDAHLIVAGSGSERESLESKAVDMRLRDIQFTGRYERKQLGDLFGCAAMSVHPSRWFENSPFAVRESLLYGLPAIVSDIGGLPEMVDQGFGAVVPPGNPQALAGAILAEFERLAAGTQSLRDQVARRAISDTTHLEGLDHLYTSLIE
jgi:glycosyltransferase involved in cell wall biosynthesis